MSNYLASHDTLPYYIANAGATNIGAHGGVYNRAGRGYPDVSANGAFLASFNNATLLTFFGTSLASPIFASVLTLINEELALVGKGPVGFVNPALYERECSCQFMLFSHQQLILLSDPEVLNDITNGSNPNCGKYCLPHRRRLDVADKKLGSEGFKTAKGWDPVTGLGTPNYPKMLELFMSLP